MNYFSRSYKAKVPPSHLTNEETSVPFTVRKQPIERPAYPTLPHTARLHTRTDFFASATHSSTHTSSSVNEKVMQKAPVSATTSVPCPSPTHLSFSPADAPAHTCDVVQHRRPSASSASRAGGTHRSDTDVTPNHNRTDVWVTRAGVQSHVELLCADSAAALRAGRMHTLPQLAVSGSGSLPSHATRVAPFASRRPPPPAPPLPSSSGCSGAECERSEADSAATRAEPACQQHAHISPISSFHAAGCGAVSATPTRMQTCTRACNRAKECEAEEYAVLLTGVSAAVVLSPPPPQQLLRDAETEASHHSAMRRCVSPARCHASGSRVCEDTHPHPHTRALFLSLKANEEEPIPNHSHPTSLPLAASHEPRPDRTHSVHDNQTHEHMLCAEDDEHVTPNAVAPLPSESGETHTMTSRRCEWLLRLGATPPPHGTRADTEGCAAAAHEAAVWCPRERVSPTAWRTDEDDTRATRAPTTRTGGCPEWEASGHARYYHTVFGTPETKLRRGRARVGVRGGPWAHDPLRDHRPHPHRLRLRLRLRPCPCRRRRLRCGGPWRPIVGLFLLLRRGVSMTHLAHAMWYPL